MRISRDYGGSLTFMQGSNFEKQPSSAAVILKRVLTKKKVMKIKVLLRMMEGEAVSPNSPPIEVLGTHMIPLQRWIPAPHFEKFPDSFWCGSAGAVSCLSC